MNLNYYGSSLNYKILSITNDYKGIRHPDELYLALLKVWSEETCTPRLRVKWNEENVTLGQCSITAFLAQDIFGGRVFGISRPDGSYHCFNIVGGNVFDLTSEQFGDEKLDYSNAIEQFRDVHFSDENKKERYEYLCVKLKEFLELADETTEIKKHKNYFYIFLCIIVGISYFLYMVMEIKPDLSATARNVNGLIPIEVGGKTYNVTPGENVTVNTPEGTTTYDVRFVGGKPVALDMSQYNTLVLGETPKKEENKPLKKEEYKINEKSEIPEIPKKQNAEPLNDFSHTSNEHNNESDIPLSYPFKPIPAQTSYPIVFNVEIKRDEDYSDEDVTEGED